MVASARWEGLRCGCDIGDLEKQQPREAVCA